MSLLFSLGTATGTPAARVSGSAACVSGAAVRVSGAVCRAAGPAGRVSGARACVTASTICRTPSSTWASRCGAVGTTESADDSSSTGACSSRQASR